MPGKYSGAPVLRGTRVPPEAIVVNYEGGLSVDEIAENYPSVFPGDYPRDTGIGHRESPAGRFVKVLLDEDLLQNLSIARLIG